MANSNLDTIYNAMAGWSFAVAGGDVKCRKPETLKKTLHSHDLPLRMLLPMDNKLEGQEATIQTMGKAATGGCLMVVRWRLMDLMYWQAVAKGTGMEQAAERLTEYCQTYLNNYRFNHKLADNIRIVNVNVEPGQYQWPLDVEAAPWYFGALATLEITEVVC